MSDPSVPGSSESGKLNSELKASHDTTYAEEQHGSTPLDTISLREQGPAVWPVIWAVVTLVLVGITIFLIFG